MLSRGDKGQAVVELQERLIALGYALPRWGADGHLGDETLAAVARFVADHGARDPDVVSDADLELVRAAVSAKTVPTPAKERLLYRGYPNDWGGGIHGLTPTAKPFFARLFELMEERGHSPRSNYPHHDVSGDGLPDCLDIVDNAWSANAWQSPVEPYVTFYRDLGELAQRVGLVWGGNWKSYSGDDSGWAKRWRAATGLGDMIHVEWRPSCGKTPKG